MTGEVQATDLAARLRRAVQGTVSDGARRRAEYSSDAGNYRVLPLVVVEPMDVDDVLATLDVSRDLGVPVVGRGGGTSIAWSKGSTNSSPAPTRQRSICSLS